MFDNKRYTTKGINERVPVGIQLILWDLIDDLNKIEDFKVDYLQVFNLNREGKALRIEHSQEVEEYKVEYTINADGADISNEKIYVIDSGEYSTMLLAEEY